jgi:hypothetical protein
LSSILAIILRPFKLRFWPSFGLLLSIFSSRIFRNYRRSFMASLLPPFKPIFWLSFWPSFHSIIGFSLASFEPTFAT